jgi:tyrosine-protein kinase Etk/Wzc
VGREILNEKVREIDNQINALRLKLQKRTDEFLQSLAPSQSGGGQGDAAGYLRTVKQKIIESQIEVQSLIAKKRALEDVIRQYEGQFERIPRKSVQLARLQRSRLSNEKLYLMVEEKFNEANITEKSNIGYIEVVEPAAPPSRPSSPRVFVNLAIGIVFGLVFGLAVAFVKEFIDVRIHAPEDLKRRGFVPLVTIKNIEEEVARLGGPRKTGEATDALARQLVTVSYPFSSVAESFRQLRTSLQYGKHGETISTILVTSPTPGEGKTTTVSNLAVAFAQAGRKVLLVDGDLRRPTVDGTFGARKEPGIAEFLAGKATLHAVVQRTAVEHLSVVACGALPPNPAEILGSKRMKEFLEQAKKEFEVILFDSSPVLAVTDPSVLSTVADGTILVVSASRTRMDELQQSTEMLESVGGKVFGVAINNFDVKRAYGISPRRARSGGYGYGRVYGDERRAAEETPEEKTPTTTS